MGARPSEWWAPAAAGEDPGSLAGSWRWAASTRDPAFAEVPHEKALYKWTSNVEYHQNELMGASMCRPPVPHQECPTCASPHSTHDPGTSRAALVVAHGPLQPRPRCWRPSSPIPIAHRSRTGHHKGPSRDQHEDVPITCPYQPSPWTSAIIASTPQTRQPILLLLLLLTTTTPKACSQARKEPQGGALVARQRRGPYDRRRGRPAPTGQPSCLP